MSYETDPLILCRHTDEEWDALLASVWSAPLPREAVRLVEEPTRKQRIEAMLASGQHRKDVAAALNLSISMVSLILSGKRN